MEDPKNFKFQKTNRSEIEKEILNLGLKKARQENDIPTKIIKENTKIFAKLIENNLMHVLMLQNFLVYSKWQI